MLKNTLFLVTIAALGWVNLCQAQVNPVAIVSPAPAVAEPSLPPNFHRDKPPYIIIKLDDLVCAPGDHLPPNWQHIEDDIKARNIKANIGLICNTLEADNPNYIQWIKDLHATGMVEFWFHAYDHRPHITNGLAYGELDGRTYDDLKQRFTKSQNLAMSKLGFALHTYGQPGASPIPGAQLDKTSHYESPELMRVLQEDPDITVWLQATLKDAVAKQIEAQGKITVLDRVYQVNIEQPIFKPNYAKFVQGYGAFPGREYFVIQGHPGFWKGDGFAQFDKILDFLQKQNAVFVSPTEMAAILKKESVTLDPYKGSSRLTDNPGASQFGATLTDSPHPASQASTTPSTTSPASNATSAPAAATAGPKVTVVPDKTSAIYKPGEKISWTVTVSGGDATVELTKGSYALKKAGKTMLDSGSLVFNGNSATISTTLNEPGTIRAEVSIPVTGKRPIQAVGGAAIAPEKIQRSAPCPDDFDAFWKSKLDELAKVPENPVLVKEDVGNPAIDYYKITMDNIRGTHIQGQFARPIGEKKCPAMVIFQFAGVYALDKKAVARAADGWLILNINAHDLPIDEQPSFYLDQAKGPLKDYTAINNDDREKSYFLRMFLACSRAVDYMSERPDWDGKTLIVTGTSQGGLQSFVAAGLNPKVTAMMTVVPAGCDNSGDLVGRLPGWPYWMSKSVGKDPTKARQTSLYYDAVNFAARVKCPALVGLGLIDPTAAPSGVLAAVNQLTGPKEVLILPGSDHYGHGGTQQPFVSRASRWREALQKGQPIPIEPGDVPAASK